MCPTVKMSRVRLAGSYETTVNMEGTDEGYYVIKMNERVR